MIPFDICTYPVTSKLKKNLKLIMSKDSKILLQGVLGEMEEGRTRIVQREKWRDTYYSLESIDSLKSLKMSKTSINRQYFTGY